MDGITAVEAVDGSIKVTIPRSDLAALKIALADGAVSCKAMSVLAQLGTDKREQAVNSAGKLERLLRLIAAPAPKPPSRLHLVTK